MSFIRRWLGGGVCTSQARLDGKTVIITGSNTGIGKETAIDLAKRGATVVMACRNVDRGEAALKDVQQESGSDKVHFQVLDLASLKSVRAFSDAFLAEHEKLDILINNAGIMMCPYSKTEDGFESQFGVNHLGHFALTNLLLPRLVECAPSRIVNVSSTAHTPSRGMKFNDINFEHGYSPSRAYWRSKLANILFTKELDRKLKNTGVSSFVLHPGVIATNLARYSTMARIFYTFSSPFIKSALQGAQTSIYCAVTEGLEEHSGSYFSDCALASSSSVSQNVEMAKKLWDVSEEMTGVKWNVAIENQDSQSRPS